MEDGLPRTRQEPSRKGVYSFIIHPESVIDITPPSHPLDTKKKKKKSE